MSKILAVFGGTGQQGGSIVQFVLNDPELSKEFKIRAITRDPSSEKAQQLGHGGKVEVVSGDAGDRASLETALTGVHTVFAMTVPTFGPGGFDIEYNAGKTIADVAVEKGAKYIIFSTLPDVKKISKGKYTTVKHFDSKAAVEQYIRGLPIKSAFFSAGGFMENFHAMPFFTPQRSPEDSNTWVIARANSPSAATPLINATADTGKFIGAILADPDKFEHKTVIGAQAFYTLDEVASIISRSTGKHVVYKQLSLQDFRDTLPVWIADVLSDVLAFSEEFGYYGPDAEKTLAWSVENARGKLTTFEEYLKTYPLQLE